MFDLKKIFFFLSLFVLCIVEIIAYEGDCSSLDQSVIIRNQYSGLVIYATSPQLITIESYDKSDEQQWYFQLSGTAGAFNIISKSTGLALDVNLEENSENTASHNLTLNSLTDSLQQRWSINSDGTIVNDGLENGTYAINIDQSNYTPGTQLIAYPVVGNLTDNERFNLEFQNK